jgi:Fe-S-cluster containining protein
LAIQGLEKSIISNPFEKELGIPLPQCCSLGSCCKGASPSKPYHQLLKRAAQGDEFARGFFSIMVPYPNHAAAEAVVPGLVERSLKAAAKLEDFSHPEEDLVFYHCQYQTEDNRCGVWEDRPQFCRDYPDTPFVVMAPGCAFEDWGAACKKKYNQLKEEVSQLKNLKAELAKLQTRQQSLSTGMEIEAQAEKVFSSSVMDDVLAEVGAIEAGISVALSMTSIYVSTPLRSSYFLFFEGRR